MSKELKSISSEITSEDLSIIGISSPLSGLSLAQTINSLFNSNLRLCKDFEHYDKDENKSFPFRNYYYLNKNDHLSHFLISNKNKDNKFIINTNVKYDYIYVIIGRDNKSCASNFIEKTKGVDNILLVRNIHPTPTTKEHFKKQNTQTQQTSLFEQKITPIVSNKKPAPKKQKVGIVVEHFIEDIDFYLEKIMTNKRIFLAYNIVFNKELLGIIKQIHSFLSKENIDSTQKNNYHLTIEFVGDSTTKQVNNIIAASSEVLNNFKEIEIEIDKVSVFENSPKDIVIWFGIKENQTLKDLNIQINNEYTKVIPIEKREFIPHITITKIKKAESNSEIIKHIQSLFNIQPQKLILRNPILYESVSIGNKMRYDIVKMF